jgi:hypothetical protein
MLLEFADAAEPNENFGVCRVNAVRRALERFWDYQRYAAECVLLAEEMSDSAQKARLLAMASGWLHLAALAEKNSLNDVVYETPVMAVSRRPNEGTSGAP